MTFFLLGLLAHVVADFALQAGSMVESKGKRMIRGYLKHGAVVFASNAVAFHVYGFRVAATLALVVAITHVAIDWLKTLAERGGAGASVRVSVRASGRASGRAGVSGGVSSSAGSSMGSGTGSGAGSSGSPSASSTSSSAIGGLDSRLDGRGSPARGLLVFLADQCAHVAVLVGIWEFAADVYVGRLSPSVLRVYEGVFLRKTVPALLPTCTALALSLDRALVITLAYVTVVFAGAVFVRRALDAFSIYAEPRLATSAGRYIGMAERALMLTLVLVDALPSIAFVLTAKSLARFQELNDMRFAEYYLVGTLMSAVVALSVGIVARAVIQVL
ncbi:MAG: DUF3307 domain-containing protein [Clostridia bacterium]